jgi:hypothetical protein
MSGSNLVNGSATYGTMGTAAPSNVPGARVGAVGWTDAAGNLWLFSGASPGVGKYNDLWKYSADQWTWISGSNLPEQQGTYGTQGTAAAGNVPGARYTAVGWTDAAGTFWLFGGIGVDSVATNGAILNDLWKYSAGQWTWMSGSKTDTFPAYQTFGIYGSQGIAAPSNVPGSRWSAVTWTDAAGNLWLFGGISTDSTGQAVEYFNDLWKFEP